MTVITTATFAARRESPSMPTTIVVPLYVIFVRRRLVLMQMSIAEAAILRVEIASASMVAELLFREPESIWLIVPVKVVCACTDVVR